MGCDLLKKYINKSYILFSLKKNKSCILWSWTFKYVQILTKNPVPNDEKSEERIRIKKELEVQGLNYNLRKHRLLI